MPHDRTLRCVLVFCILAIAQTQITVTKGYGQRPLNAKWVTAPLGYDPSWVAGHEANGAPLYVCRADYQGGVHPGKVVAGNCNIGWGGMEVALQSFEVLVASRLQDPEMWKTGFLPGNPNFVAGNESTGAPLYVCRAAFRGGVHPGKVVAGNCNIGWGGMEVALRSFEVLQSVSSNGAGAQQPASSNGARASQPTARAIEKSLSWMVILIFWILPLFLYPLSVIIISRFLYESDGCQHSCALSRTRHDHRIPAPGASRKFSRASTILLFQFYLCSLSLLFLLTFLKFKPPGDLSVDAVGTLLAIPVLFVIRLLRPRSSDAWPQWARLSIRWKVRDKTIVFSWMP